MAEGGEKQRRGGLTPEQQAERFSTGGLDFEDSVRRVLAGGPDDEYEQEAVMGEHSGVAERQLTDPEIIGEIERMRAGVMDGTVPIFFDAESAIRYRQERFGV